MKKRRKTIKIDKRVQVILCNTELGPFFHLFNGSYGMEWFPSKKSLTKLHTVIGDFLASMEDKDWSKHEED
jgi:hypothetical protein